MRLEREHRFFGLSLRRVTWVNDLGHRLLQDLMLAYETLDLTMELPPNLVPSQLPMQQVGCKYGCIVQPLLFEMHRDTKDCVKDACCQIEADN